MTCRLLLVSLAGVLASIGSAAAACTDCSSFEPGVAWGAVMASPITEASGIVASRRNPGVLWIHNDGSRDRVFAVSTNGALLATFDFGKNVDDLEDLAAGPGPDAGTSYLYIGDIGGDAGTNTTRSEIKVIRIAEPRVELAWQTDPLTSDVAQADHIILLYPDGSYDAEVLLMDPLSGDIVVITKDPHLSRIYRANILTAGNRDTLTMEFVMTLGVTNLSAGDISPDGTEILLRREDFAMRWKRCDAEPIQVALSRPGQAVPVIGPPTEPNGEGIGFVASGSGYVTISEGIQPVIYFFQGTCDQPPQFTLKLSDQSVIVGGVARFEVMTTGYPTPAFSWRFNGQPLPEQQSSFLVLSNITAASAGEYEVTASNASGAVTSTARLTVRNQPNLRITEVMPAPAQNSAVDTADWWELTSFETEPVNLSGWRFNDNGGGFSDPFILPTGITIAPRESIVFVENLTPAQFRAWWGSAAVPPSVQIITYRGAGLGLGAGGDGLRLWNSTATDLADTVATVDFGAADPGVTFNFDPVSKQFGAKSQLGVNGVVRAAGGTDIGSPGKILGPAAPPTLTVKLAGETLRIEFDAEAGHRYRLQSRDDLTVGSWNPTGDILDAATNTRAFFDKPATDNARFYQVTAE
jgi:hypothetical protein